MNRRELIRGIAAAAVATAALPAAEAFSTDNMRPQAMPRGNPPLAKAVCDACAMKVFVSYTVERRGLRMCAYCAATDGDGILIIGDPGWHPGTAEEQRQWWDETVRRA